MRENDHNKKIKDCSFVIFNLETTGISFEKDQIIEISSRKIDSSGKLIATFHRYIKLYKIKKLSYFVSHLSHITNDVLIKKGEKNITVLNDFFNFIKGSILVNHNKFLDMYFLSSSYEEINKYILDIISLDIIDYAKIMFPMQKSYQLESLYNLYDCIIKDKDSFKYGMLGVKMVEEIFIKQLKIMFIDKNYVQDLIISNPSGLVTTNKKKNFVKMLN